MRNLEQVLNNCQGSTLSPRLIRLILQETNDMSEQTVTKEQVIEAFEASTACETDTRGNGTMKPEQIIEVVQGFIKSKPLQREGHRDQFHDFDPTITELCATLGDGFEVRIKPEPIEFYVRKQSVPLYSELVFIQCNERDPDAFKVRELL
jgi:hypothetical protein